MQTTKRTSFRGEKEEELSDFSDISCPDTDVSQSKTAKKATGKKKKRHKFSYVEDIKMLKYIMSENRYNEIKGISLWKDMEILEITSHTSQSMKFRFLNTVIQNLHKYNIDKVWVNTLFQNYPDLVPHTRKKGSKSILDTLQKKTRVLRSSKPAEAAKKALREWKELQQQQQGEEEEEEKVADDERIEEVNEHESDHDEEQSLKKKQLLKERQKKHKRIIQRVISTSESEPEDTSVATTQESSHCVSNNNQVSDTEEPTDTSDYDRNLINMAKKTASNSNPSQEKTSEYSSSSQLAEESMYAPPSDRRTQLKKKRKSQKLSLQSSVLPSTSRDELFADPSSSSECGKLTSLANFITNEETTNSSHRRRISSNKPVKTNDLDLVIRIINDMCTKFQLDVKEVLATLGSTNGNVNQAISYIKFGPKLSGVSPWAQKEDDIISSTDEKQLNEILQKRGHVAVAKRLQFLENL